MINLMLHRMLLGGQRILARKSLIRYKSTKIVQLRAHIAENQLSEALTLFQALPSAPSTETMQRLAVLLCKHEVEHVQRGYEILKDLYTSPSFLPDAYSPVAFIFIVDACLRHNMVAEAIQVSGYCTA